jgi:hypothetical protein
MIFYIKKLTPKFYIIFNKYKTIMKNERKNNTTY